MKLTKTNILMSLLLTLFFLAGCGSILKPLATPITHAVSHAREYMKPQPGFGIGTHRASGVNASALFAVSAPTDSATPQSYNGYCKTIPAGRVFEFYGLGYFDDDCAGTTVWTDLPANGQLVVDDGTVETLVVTSQTPETNPAGATFTIYVGSTPNAVGTVSTVSCTIPAGAVVCKDKVNSVVVKDGQWVSILGNNGEGLSNVQAVFAKN